MVAARGGWRGRGRAEDGSGGGMWKVAAAVVHGGQQWWWCAEDGVWRMVVAAAAAHGGQQWCCAGQSVYDTSIHYSTTL